MRYCIRCLYSENHPLHLTFDHEGVCSGCRVHEEKDTLDWSGRLEKLKRLVAGYKVASRPIHDCIVPVGGARDSWLIVHVVKHVLGLRPLLVTYNDIDCFHYSGLHDYIKFLKWGYGKVTDYATREIRLNRLTREQGIDLVARYADTPPADLPLFLDWLSIPEREFWSAVDTHRGPRAWTQAGGQWKLIDSILQHRNDAGVDAGRVAAQGLCDFQLTPSKEPGVPDDRYILIGRGWVDQPAIA